MINKHTPPCAAARTRPRRTLRRGGGCAVGARGDGCDLDGEPRPRGPCGASAWCTSRRSAPTAAATLHRSLPTLSSAGHTPSSPRSISARGVEAFFFGWCSATGCPVHHTPQLHRRHAHTCPSPGQTLTSCEHVEVAIPNHPHTNTSSELINFIATIIFTKKTPCNWLILGCECL